MSTCGAMRAASAWTIWARPISSPSGVTPELLDMFWALKGATRIPRRRMARQSAVTTTLLPTSDPVPRTAMQGATWRFHFSIPFRAGTPAWK